MGLACSIGCNLKTVTGKPAVDSAIPFRHSTCITFYLFTSENLPHNLIISLPGEPPSSPSFQEPSQQYVIWIYAYNSNLLFYHVNSKGKQGGSGCVCLTRQTFCYDNFLPVPLYKFLAGDLIEGLSHPLGMAGCTVHAPLSQLLPPCLY